MRTSPCFLVCLALLPLGLPLGRSLGSTAGDTAQRSEPLELSLGGAAAQALSGNLGLQIERLGPERSELNVIAAESAFDPFLTLDAGMSETQSPSAASELDGAAQPVTENQSVAGSLGKDFALGGNLRLSTGVDRRETNSTFARFNPDFSSDISLTGSQPLLRGFGRQVNLAPIARAQLGAENALWQMREAALDILRDVELAYWNLSLAQARLRLRESSVELAETLLEENRERAALGLESELAVLQAEAGLAERREEQIVAHQAVERASDRLHRVMGTLEVQPVKLRAARFPRAEARAPDYDLVLKRVLEGDIQSRIRTNRISQEELDLLVARDRARPNLEASFSAGYLGRSEEGYEAFENTLNRDGYRWRGDLRLSLPLGLREGRARRRQAFLSLREEEIAFELYRQDLLEETRMLFRSVTAGIQRIEASKAAFELNQLTFEQTRAEYEEGLSSFRAVLEAQQDLEEARLRDLEARVDLLRARVRLSRLDNTLLERHGFRWEEIDEPSRITASPIAPLPDENGHEAR